jgi:hypothetical protein
MVFMNESGADGSEWVLLLVASREFLPGARGSQPARSENGFE